MFFKNHGGEGMGEWEGPRKTQPFINCNCNGNKVERWGTRSGRQRAVLESEKTNRGRMTLATR